MGRDAGNNTSVSSLLLGNNCTVFIVGEKVPSLNKLKEAEEPVGAASGTHEAKIKARHSILIKSIILVHDYNFSTLWCV